MGSGTVDAVKVMPEKSKVCLPALTGNGESLTVQVNTICSPAVKAWLKFNVCACSVLITFTEPNSVLEPPLME